MKNYLIILLIAMLPTLALAQKAGGHITRPGKAKPKTEKTTTTKKQTTSKPQKKQNGTKSQKNQNKQQSEFTPYRPLDQSVYTPQPNRSPQQPTPQPKPSHYNSESKSNTYTPKPSKTLSSPSSSYYTEDSRGNRIYTVKGVQFTMVAVPGGTFTMGATSEQGSEANSTERPIHKVTLSSYYIGQTEVTQALWQAVMGNNPSHFIGQDRPVEQVSWNDCQKFIRRLNTLTGEHFKLPTEAQWEYAARGGNFSRGYKYSGSNSLSDIAWYTNNSGNVTQVVAKKNPNELGIYDMSGNVWEWCEDKWGVYGSFSLYNPTGNSTGTGRVFRGGCFSGGSKICRVSNRGLNTPDRWFDYLGLRLAL